MSTTTVPAVPPGPAQVEEAIATLNKAAKDLVLAGGQVSRVSRFEGDQPPTFEDVGRMYAFALELRARLNEMDSYVTGIEKALRDLDYVREQGNVDPDTRP
jgi:hypothetical protein